MSSGQDIWKRVFKKKEAIVAREIAGETILVPIKGKLADMQRIFSVDQVAEYIWQRLDGETSIKEICGGVVDAFEVEKEQAGGDILAFIEELLEAELIVRVT